MLQSFSPPWDPGVGSGWLKVGWGRVGVVRRDRAGVMAARCVSAVRLGRNGGAEITCNFSRGAAPLRWRAAARSLKRSTGYAPWITSAQASACAVRTHKTGITRSTLVTRLRPPPKVRNDGILVRVPAVTPLERRRDLHPAIGNAELAVDCGDHSTQREFRSGKGGREALGMHPITRFKFAGVRKGERGIPELACAIECRHVINRAADRVRT